MIRVSSRLRPGASESREREKHVISAVDGDPGEAPARRRTGENANQPEPDRQIADCRLAENDEQWLACDLQRPRVHAADLLALINYHGVTPGL